MPYFDTTDDDHKAMLPPGIRDDGDLADVAADAEADVIDHFTEGPEGNARPLRYVAGRDRTELTDADGDGIGLYVYLMGYAADPASAEQNLVAAMRRTIAEVIRWRMAQRKKAPLKASESGDAGTFSGFSFRGDSERPFPPNAFRRLRKYDTRRSLESI